MRARDQDAFYAQVDSRRLGLGDDTPLVTAQHGMLIAVSYSARKFGISRLKDTAATCREKCPEVVVASVDVVNGKPNLTRYRDASVLIFEVLTSFGAPVERAGIDEAYFDATELVADLMRLNVETPSFDGSHVVRGDANDAKKSSAEESDDDDDNEDDDDDDDADDNVVNDEQLEDVFEVDDDTKNDSATIVNTTNNNNSTNNNKANINDANSYNKIDNPFDDDAERRQCERRLAFGATIARNVRAQILAKLQFTVSAGVSFNKTLAKIGSGFKKPNAQTIILPSSVYFLFASLSVRKLPGLGRKVRRFCIYSKRRDYAFLYIHMFIFIFCFCCLAWKTSD